MFFTAQMRYIQIVILEKDFQKTIDLLADFGWIEIKRDKEEKKDKIDEITKKINIIEDKIYHIIDFIGINKSVKEGSLKDLNEISNYFDEVEKQIGPFKEKIKLLENRKRELENGIKEIEQFKDLKITKEELNKLNFLYFTIGSIGAKDLDELSHTMKGRLAHVELSRDLYLLFTSKKGRWTLDSELKKFHFKEKNLPFEDDILPPEVYERLNNERTKIDEELKNSETFKKEIIKSEGHNISRMIESFNLQKIYQDIFKNINHSGATTIIEGWVRKSQIDVLLDKIYNLLGQKVSVVIHKPEEMEEVKRKTLKVPVKMENFFIFKAFEKIVFNYGAPPYGTIDPTIPVTISFLILFGLMFGDMGQGLLILLTGILLRFAKPFKKLADVAPILISVGISAMIFGYLYGAAFCFEYEQIGHVLRPINRTLFGIDKPNIINISIHDIGSVLNLFILTIGFGIIINLLGKAVNIINNLLKKNIGEALFSRTGLAGFIMLFSIGILFLQYFVFKTALSYTVGLVAVIAIVFILLKEPLSNILNKKGKLFDHGIGMWILHSVVELIEIILSTMSNNLSFIRVGAFAFAHVLLSVTTLKLAEVIGGSLTSVSAILIIIFGNLLITVLEGMIVGIQTIRLEYYEFFSKFFTDLGKEFKPFKIEKNILEENK